MKARKIAALCLAAVMLVAASVAGTLAYLKAETTAVTNTFTTTDISLTLDEAPLVREDGKVTDGRTIDTKAERVQSEDKYVMVPGATLQKDPLVTVGDDSVTCWVFVEVTKENNFDDYMTCAMDEHWTPVPNTTNVYYQENVAAGSKLHVLAEDKVTVNTTVTKTMMEAAKTALPKLSFKAYAVQTEGLEAVADAWAAAQKLDPAYPAPQCNCEPVDGAHAETCPLYVAPEGTENNENA